MYALAHALHKCVYEIGQMPTSEYMGWLLFFAEQNRQQEVSKGNLLAMNEDEVMERFSE